MENQNNDSNPAKTGTQPNQEQVTNSQRNEDPTGNPTNDASVNDNIRNTQVDTGENLNKGTSTSTPDDLSRKNGIGLNNEEDEDDEVPEINNTTNRTGEERNDEDRTEEERNDITGQDRTGNPHAPESESRKDILDPNKTRL